MGVRSVALFALAWWGIGSPPPGRCVGPPVRMLEPDLLDVYGPEGHSVSLRRFVAGDRQLRMDWEIIAAASLVTGKSLARAQLPFEIREVQVVAVAPRGFLIASPRDGGALVAIDVVGTEPLVRWRTPLAAGEELFTGAAGADLGGLVVRRFDPRWPSSWLGFDLVGLETATGRIRWRVPFEPARVVETENITVLVDDARVYLFAPASVPASPEAYKVPTFWVTAYDARAGTPLWKYDTDQIHLPAAALDGGRLIVESPAGLGVLDARTGTELRRFERFSHLGRMRIAVAGGTAYVDLRDGDAVVAVDLTTGRERWRWEGSAE